MSIRILLADDPEIVLNGLCTLLEQQTEMTGVEAVRDGQEAVQAARAKSPDVVIMDLSMPGMNGIEATRRISAELPAVKVLCLSMHADRRFVLDVLEAGAVGYLLKECALEEVVRAIRAVVGNQTYLSPRIAGVVVEAYRAKKTETPVSRFSLLTAREREVLQLIAEGHSTQEMADRLHVSHKTVSTHRENLMRKLDVHTIAGLTKYAIRRGLTSLEE
jgi:DNA-binding NarL/FixJ family response regulator